MSVIDVERLTEEDRQIVAKAVLAGVTLRQASTGYWWGSIGGSEIGDGGMFTAARAASKALVFLGVMTEAEKDEYIKRTATAAIDVWRDAQEDNR